MSQSREILRLRWEQGRSLRETARALSVSPGTVAEQEARARRAGLGPTELSALTDEELEGRLYAAPKAVAASRPRPDPEWMHAELRRPGVTVELLHLEYLEAHPDGYRYTAFADVYRHWLKKRGVTMRQLHKAGDKAFVDYSGKKAQVVDPTTGEIREVELFVFVLGASNYTFAEATWTQTVGDFVASHVRALEFIGGVPRMLVPDQLRSAISIPCRYEPTTNRTYAEFGRHYGTSIVPARPRKPRDKAKVEVAVQIAQRWILACLRNETFFSLETLNRRIRELLVRLNDRPMTSYGGRSRRQLFEQVERAALAPLPETPFETSEWKRATVSGDYHIAVDHHFYSVPYSLVRDEVEVRLTATTLEAFFRGRRVAAHPRSYEKHRFTTEPGHMPEAHRQQFRGEDAVREWARTVGPWTEAMVGRIFDAHIIRERGWRSCKGLQRLEGVYGKDRLEAACHHASHFGARSYRPIASILKLGRDAAPFPDAPRAEAPSLEHENVRGPFYFH